jgi:pimeloyl-ACP methyl ester carboxylesterase
MRKLLTLGAVVIAGVVTFFSTSLLTSAYYTQFLFSTSTVAVAVPSLTSNTTDFVVTTDPSYHGYFGNDAPYRIVRTPHCDSHDTDFNCVPALDLCQYLSITPNSGESTETGFDQDAAHPFLLNAEGNLNMPTDAQDEWKLNITAPCFEGECPLNYDPYTSGTPLAQSMKGMTFKCDLTVESRDSGIFLVKGLAHTAYAATMPNVIEVSATLTGAVAQPACTTDCYSVMFVPGLAASRLYRGSDKVWFPFANGTDLDAKDLFLNASGTSIRSDISVKDGDIVEDAYNIEDIYKGLPELFNSLRSAHTIADWNIASYDWRLDYDTLLNSGVQTGDLISYLTPTSTPYILQTLRTLAAEAKDHKVIIVTHSNGGLLVKALIKKLEDAHDPLVNNIEQVILVAPPQLGAPKSIVSMLHGDENPLKSAGSLPMSNNAFRKLTENMPSMFNLLPSYSYGYLPSTPFASFDYPSGHGDIENKAFSKYGAYDMDPLLNQMRSSYPNTTITRDNLINFLTGENGQRAKPAANDLTSPNVLSLDLLAHSAEVHGPMDIYHFPSSIKVTQVAGWGLETISGIEYMRGDPSCVTFGFVVCKPTFALDRKPTTKADGDGTVPVDSALAMDDATKVFVDLKSYNATTTGDSIKVREHDNIMGSQPVKNLIEHLVKHESIDAIPYTSVVKPTGTHYTMAEKHSPVDLDVYDSNGNHTGYTYKIIDGTRTRVIEENIPNSSYIVMGSSSYVVFPSDEPTQVKMSGTGEGTVTFKLTESIDDTVTATSTFLDIPVTASSTGMITVGTVASASPLIIDENGDGTPDFTLAPKLNDIVVPDFVAPVTIASTTGTLGTNNWYTSNVTVRFFATDTGSSVKNTYYSQNGGLWNIYSTSSPLVITNEGSTTILYYSTDSAGNKEATNTLVLKIDKTAPEASITFEPITQLLRIAGSDNLSSTTVATTATSSLITDGAGHTLKVLLADLKPKTKLGRINMSVTALVYDGVTTPLASTTFKYKWATTTPNTTYKTFAAFLTTKSTSTEAHFRPKKAQTIVMTTPVDIDDNDIDDACDTRATKVKLTGMVVPRMDTSKGIVSVNY